MLSSDINIFRFTINIGEHRVIILRMLSLSGTSCHYTMTFYHFILHHVMILSHPMILLFYHVLIFHRNFFRQRHVLSLVMLSLYLPSSLYISIGNPRMLPR